MINKLKNKKGFTLIELMIVIAIIGVLSAIAIPNYLSYRSKGANIAAKAEANNFYIACLADFADDGIVKTFSAIAAPTNFSPNPEVTNLCVLDINAAGVVTLTTPTFKHTTGDITYTLNVNGGIT